MVVFLDTAADEVADVGTIVVAVLVTVLGTSDIDKVQDQFSTKIRNYQGMITRRSKLG